MLAGTGVVGVDGAVVLDGAPVEVPGDEAVDDVTDPPGAPLTGAVEDGGAPPVVEEVETLAVDVEGTGVVVVRRAPAGMLPPCTVFTSRRSPGKRVVVGNEQSGAPAVASVMNAAKI